MLGIGYSNAFYYNFWMKLEPANAFHASWFKRNILLVWRLTQHGLSKLWLCPKLFRRICFLTRCAWVTGVVISSSNDTNLSTNYNPITCKASIRYVFYGFFWVIVGLNNCKSSWKCHKIPAQKDLTLDIGCTVKRCKKYVLFRNLQHGPLTQGIQQLDHNLVRFSTFGWENPWDRCRGGKTHMTILWDWNPWLNGPFCSSSESFLL